MQTEPNLLTAVNADQNQTAKPDGVPEKFWDEQKKEIRLDALLSSYLALEKKMASMIHAPDSEEGRTKILKALGRPDTPDAYDIDVSHGLFEIDSDLNARLHEKGFTPDQVQTVYDAAAEKLIPLIVELASQFQADREVERLVSEFGGLEQWNTVSRQLQAFGKQNLPAEVLKGLSSSYDGVMALYRLMKGEGHALKMRDDGASSNAVDDKTLQKMMRDPKYWRDRNPDIMAKVADGFKQLYG